MTGWSYLGYVAPIISEPLLPRRTVYAACGWSPWTCAFHGDVPAMIRMAAMLLATSVWASWITIAPERSSLLPTISLSSPWRLVMLLQLMRSLLLIVLPEDLKLSVSELPAARLVQVLFTTLAPTLLFVSAVDVPIMRPGPAPGRQS